MNAKSESNHPSDGDFWRQRYLAGDTPWDKGRAHPALEHWLQKGVVSAGERVLIPGCGAGHDARSWAAAGAFAIGLDIAPEAVELARKTTPASLAAKTQFLTGSIFSPPAELLGTMDWVFEHTCFCAFHPENRMDYAKAVSALLKPGGNFLAVFYMRPDHEEGPPFGVEENELFSLFGPDFECSGRQIAEPTFEGREGREELWLWRRKS